MGVAFGARESREVPAPPGSDALREAILRGEARKAAACFTRDGCLVTPDDTVVHGRAAIAAVLRQLSANLVGLRAEHLAALAADDVALVYERWTIQLAGPEPDGYVRSPLATLVARRVEGRWKLAIAAPWGWPRGAQLVASPIASSGKAIMMPR